MSCRGIGYEVSGPGWIVGRERRFVAALRIARVRAQAGQGPVTIRRVLPCRVGHQVTGYAYEVVRVMGGQK